MTFAMHLCLAVFLLTARYLKCVDANYNEYVSLIADVREKYVTSSVIFVFSRNISSMQKSTTAHALSRTFSEKGVFTQITGFWDLDERLNNYREKRIGRPLVVILFESFDDIDEFNMSRDIMSKSYAIWLIIFSSGSDSQFCKYCRRPEKNMFRLRFDSLMFVLCCDKPTLREWWSVHKNRTEISKFGTWTAKQRLKLLPTKRLNARRNNLKGKKLRVILMSKDSQSSHLLRELKRAMNFTTGRIVNADDFGSYNETTKSWSGVMGLLTQGKADLAVTKLHMKLSRAGVVDFIPTTIPPHTKLFIRSPDGPGGIRFAYLEVFTSEIWIMMIALVITTPVILAIMQVQHSSRSWSYLYLENYLCVWGSFCQQGLNKFSTKTSMRIAVISIYILSVVVYVAYSASLMSFLTASHSKLPFTNSNGFLEDGSYKLIVRQNGRNYATIKSSTAPVYKKMMALMKPVEQLPPTYQAAWEQVCTERVALMASERSKKEADIKCKLKEIPTGSPGSVVLPAGSPYTGTVNYHISRFRENGVLHRMGKVFREESKLVKPTFESIELSRIAATLLILTGGIILALIVFICEITYYSLIDRRRRHSLKAASMKTKIRIRHLWRDTSGVPLSSKG